MSLKEKAKATKIFIPALFIAMKNKIRRLLPKFLQELL